MPDCELLCSERSGIQMVISPVYQWRNMQQTQVTGTGAGPLHLLLTREKKGKKSHMTEVGRELEL